MIWMELWFESWIVSLKGFWYDCDKIITYLDTMLANFFQAQVHLSPWARLSDSIASACANSINTPMAKSAMI